MLTDTPLLTDLYQLTMAAGYWASGKAEQDAVFHLYFRKLPFGSGYAVAAGLADAVQWLKAFRFTGDDTAYLASLQAANGTPLFESVFLDYLRELEWTCDVDAIPEGTVVFPQQPLIRVRGPLVQAQLVETALLNVINFQTLIATKAARVCEAAEGDSVLEFGLRRAQGPNGGMMASRAAWIGGCHATSNVLAGRTLGIPVRGTHAHSWVMSFDTENEAFLAYAAAMPNNCVLLVDTYDTLEGVRRAAEVGRVLRERGHEFAGIRLDSGDLASLSLAAREILDEAGFPDAVIVASNDLNEDSIERLKHQGAAIRVWGVGTQLVTGGGQSALGGVYKLGAIREESGVWSPRIKLSEQPIKCSNPGMQQVRRFSVDGRFVGDAIFDETCGCPAEPGVVTGNDSGVRVRMPAGADTHDLLVPVSRHGKFVYDNPPLPDIRDHACRQRAQLPAGVRRLQQPDSYPAGIEGTLFEQKLALVESARAATAESAQT